MDGFGEAFEYDIQRGKKKLKSGGGAVATVFMGLMVTIYAYLRVDVFWNKSSMDVLYTIERQFLDDSYIFSS